MGLVIAVVLTDKHMGLVIAAATISGRLDSVQYPGSFSIVDFVPDLTRPLPQYLGDLILCNTRQLFGCGFCTGFDPAASTVSGRLILCNTRQLFGYGFCIGFKRDLLGRGGVMGSGHNNGPFLQPVICIARQKWTCRKLDILC